MHTTHTLHTGVWTSETICQTYLDFFRAREHVELPGGSLVAPDHSTYFTVAGMQPLLPYLRGLQSPPAPRLTALQRCLRTVDVNETGSNGHKLTLFHMLGNWSVGDYGKLTAIEMALELLTHLGLEKHCLWVTTFGGDQSLNLLPDDFTYEIWQRRGFSTERVVPLGMEDNFWDMGANVPGPCGPCTEIFVDRGLEYGCGRAECRPGCPCERFLEIWNLVFIEYDRAPDGSLNRLPFASVDTGMGLERVGMILQQVPSVFDLDLFQPASDLLRGLLTRSGEKVSGLERRAFRMILDHTRAALFACLEGVLPGQESRNSVVRRLLRRALRQGRLLGLNGPWLSRLVEPLLQGHAFLLTPEQVELERLAGIFAREEQQFQRTLTIGLKLLENLQPDERGLIPGTAIFHLHSDRGFPADLAGEILEERGLRVDWPGYELALESHRQVSRQSIARQFRSS